ncbi:hypothetical protein LTS18_006511 [Coniosporium uncinatum]|uniref:Uncharacterized protein n=1 Tax=Coniosporium uncinatum TaxID=93489 RepID=A0ACC3DXZ0_9PEZI|nr:hypothetical protein LTS18_006511 [Coniosporium uncinatum]
MEGRFKRLSGHLFKKKDKHDDEHESEGGQSQRRSMSRRSMDKLSQPWSGGEETDTGRTSIGSTQQRSSREMRNVSGGSRRSMNDNQARSPAAQAATKPTLRMVRQDADGGLDQHKSLGDGPVFMNNPSQRRYSEDVADRNLAGGRAASNETAPVIPPITAGRDFSESIADRSIAYPDNVQFQNQNRFARPPTGERQAAETSVPGGSFHHQLRSNAGQINRQVATNPVASREQQQPRYEQRITEAPRITTPTTRKPLPVPPKEDAPLHAAKRATKEPKASVPSSVARTERFEGLASPSYVPIGERQRQDDQQYLVKDSARPASLKGVVDIRNTVDTTVEEVVAPAVVHEKVFPIVKHIREEQITREIHNHHVYHRILPIIDVQVLPARHFVFNTDQTGLVEVDESQVPGRTMQDVERTNHNIKNWVIAELASKGLAQEEMDVHGPRQFSACKFEGTSGDYKEYISEDGIPRTETTWVHPPTMETGAMETRQSVPMHFGLPPSQSQTNSIPRKDMARRDVPGAWRVTSSVDTTGMGARTDGAFDSPLTGGMDRLSLDQTPRGDRRRLGGSGHVREKTDTLG